MGFFTLSFEDVLVGVVGDLVSLDWYRLVLDEVLDDGQVVEIGGSGLIDIRTEWDGSLARGGEIRSTPH